MISRYRYRAATAEGQVVEGVLQAPSRQTVLETLHRQRLYPVAVDAVGTGGLPRRRSSVGAGAALALWARNTATLLSAGLPLDRALGFIADHLGNDALRDALKRVRREVQGGASLADAVAAQPSVFSPIVAAMISAGEATGQLDVVFERLAEHLEEGTELRSQVRSALVYPALMSVVAGLGVVVLLGFVVPRFTAILQEVGGTLPLSTRLLVAVSGVLTRWWWVWLPLLGATGYAAVTALRRTRDAAPVAWLAAALALGGRPGIEVRHRSVHPHAGTVAAQWPLHSPSPQNRPHYRTEYRGAGRSRTGIDQCR